MQAGRCVTQGRDLSTSFSQKFFILLGFLRKNLKIPSKISIQIPLPLENFWLHHCHPRYFKIIYLNMK